MKAPMKRNISGSAKGANTSFAGATRSTTQAAAPSKAVTARGSASVTQSTTTDASTAASRWAAGETPESGSASRVRKATGASMAPTRWRVITAAPGVEMMTPGQKYPTYQAS